MKLTIGEKITMLRKEKNITQTELAEYLFLAPQTVSRWEVGNGAPEITLLPKIATFFGVSIDELFGMTSIERAEDLVSKYSVLRDERSFQEALKLHLWIQQGREAFQRALGIADSFLEKTEKNLEHPWYLRMRLQRNQLCIALDKGREALAECKKNFMENPNAVTLQIYLTMLSDLQNYEEILSIQKTESMAGEIIFPPSEENLSIWWQLINAAGKMGGMEFIEKYMPPILEICTKKDEFFYGECQKEHRAVKTALNDALKVRI